jgi:hypothetical protein
MLTWLKIEEECDDAIHSINETLKDLAAGIPVRQQAIVKTLQQINSAMVNWDLYDVAPDGSYSQSLPDQVSA